MPPSLPHLHLLCKLTFIGKAELYRKANREIFHLLARSSNSRNDWSWANLRPGARNFFLVSSLDTEIQGLEPFSAAFPDHKQGTRREVEQAGNWHPYRMLVLLVQA